MDEERCGIGPARCLLEVVHPVYRARLICGFVRLLSQGELVTEEMSANPIFSNSVKFNQIHN
jgi:hypothetical protein